MKLPYRIYLQWYDETEEKPIDINSGELTWCVDQINPSDAEYVLINKYKFLVSLNAQLLETLQSVEWIQKLSLNSILTFCPWCRANFYDLYNLVHKPDCQRQAAIKRSLKKVGPPNANHKTR